MTHPTDHPPGTEAEEPFAFYVLMECETCKHDMLYGLVLSTLTAHGRPVVPYDVAEQTVFSCERCGSSTYTGELDFDHEPGEEPEDDETDDDDD